MKSPLTCLEDGSSFGAPNPLIVLELQSGRGTTKASFARLRKKQNPPYIKNSAPKLFQKGFLFH
jgi:hypothetical protein